MRDDSYATKEGMEGKAKIAPLMNTLNTYVRRDGMKGNHRFAHVGLKYLS